MWMGEFNQAELKALAAGTVIPAHSGPARPGAANFVVADPSLAARSTPTVPESFHELLGERTGIQRPCVALGFAKAIALLQPHWQCGWLRLCDWLRRTAPAKELVPPRAAGLGCQAHTVR